MARVLNAVPRARKVDTSRFWGRLDTARRPLLRMPMTRSTAILAPVQSRRAAARPVRASVRSWTGRSVVTSATDRVRPRFATAGMHRTRVSEMRDAASRASAVRAVSALSGPATSSDSRRRPFSPLTSG